MNRGILFAFLMVMPLARAGDDFTIQTIAGNSNAGDNGPATGAQLVQLEGITLDGLGNIYIADAGDNRVRKISRYGVIQTIAGTGSAGFSGDGGPAISAKLNHPYGITLDLAGNVYIADLGNARVRKIDTTGSISTVAGGGLRAIPSGQAINATDAILKSPRNVVVDILGNLYISDFTANQVYEVTPSGLLTTFAGTGQPGFSGDGGAASLAQISAPAGLATDSSGSIYIADSGNGRVRRVWFGAISTVVANILSPTGVSLDAAGHLYVASLSAVAGRVPSLGGLIVYVAAAQDVASDAGGVLFLALQHSIVKMSGGVPATIAGTLNSAAFGDGGPATMARLGGPFALALNAAGEIYIAEQSANRIDRIAGNGIISIVAGASTGIASPSGIAVGTGGTVYFSDAGNNRVRRISAGGVLSTVVDKLNGVSSMRIGPDGSIYVCDSGNGRILRITPSGVVSVAASIYGPQGLAIASDGTLYVSTPTQVVQILPSSMQTTILDGLGNPRGLALMANGDLLIAEADKHRILKLGAAGLITVVAGTGAPGSDGDGGLASLAELYNPEDVAVDSAGNILIADTGNNSIRKLTPVPIAAPQIVAPLTVVNAASLLWGAVAPNEIVTIYGTGFDPAHTQVMFDNTPATVFYAGPNQLNVLVPGGVKPNATTSLNVLANGSPAGAGILNTVVAAPAIFAVSNGTGQAAALNEDGTVNSESNPLARGAIIVLFLTGDGQNGAPVLVGVGGYPADVLYAGPAPGFPGLTQINARVPAGFLPNGSQPVVVTVGGASSQAGVTIALR